MNDFVKNIIYLIVALILIFSIFAMFWTSFGYVYFLRFIVSAGFLLVGFYYLFKSRTKNNILIGIFLIILSPFFYYLFGLIFPVHGMNPLNPNVSNPNPNIGRNFFYDIWYNIRYGFFERYICFGFRCFTIGTIFLMLLFLFNGAVLTKNPKLNKIIGANLLAVFTIILIFMLFGQ